MLRINLKLHNKHRILLDFQKYQPKRTIATSETTEIEEPKTAKEQQFTYFVKNLKEKYSREGVTARQRLKDIIEYLEKNKQLKILRKNVLQSADVAKIIRLTGKPYVHVFRPERQLATENLFNLLPNIIDYTIEHYNCYLKVCLENQTDFSVQNVLVALKEKGIDADYTTHGLMLWQLCLSKNLREANQLAKKLGTQTSHLNPLIRGYFLVNDTSSAVKCYEKVVASDQSAVISVANYELINGFLMNKKFDIANGLFENMTGLTLNSLFKLYEDCLCLKADGVSNAALKSLLTRLEESLDKQHNMSKQASKEINFHVKSANLISSLFERKYDEVAFKFVSTFFDMEIPLEDASGELTLTKDVFCRCLGRTTSDYDKIIKYHLKLDLFGGKNTENGLFCFKRILFTSLLEQPVKNHDLNLRLVSYMKENDVKIREHIFYPFLLNILKKIEEKKKKFECRPERDWQELREFLKKMHTEYKVLNIDMDFTEFVDFLTLNHHYSLIHRELTASDSRMNNYYYLNLVKLFSPFIEIKALLSRLVECYYKYSIIRLQQLIASNRGFEALNLEIDIYFQFFVNLFQTYADRNESQYAVVFTFREYIRNLTRLNLLQSYLLNLKFSEGNLFKYLFLINNFEYDDTYRSLVNDVNDSVTGSYLNVKLGSNQNNSKEFIEALVRDFFENNKTVKLTFKVFDRILTDRSEDYALLKNCLEPHFYQEKSERRSYERFAVVEKISSLDFYETQLAEMSAKNKNVNPTLRKFIVYICTKFRNPDDRIIKRLNELCTQLPQDEYNGATYASLLYFHSKYVPVEQNGKLEDYYEGLVDSVKNQGFVCDAEKILSYCQYKALKTDAKFNEIVRILSNFEYKLPDERTVYPVRDLFLTTMHKYSYKDYIDLQSLLCKNRFIGPRNKLLNYFIINKLLSETKDLRLALDVYKYLTTFYSAEVDILREIVQLDDTEFLSFAVKEIAFKNGDPKYTHSCLILAYVQAGKDQGQIDTLFDSMGNHLMNVRDIESYLTKATLMMNYSSMVNQNYNLLIRNFLRYLNASDYFKRNTQKKTEIENLLKDFQKKYK